MTRATLEILLILLVGILISFFTFTYVDNEEKAKKDLAFNASAAERLALIDKNIESEFSVMRASTEFIRVSKEVSRKEFMSYANGVIGDKYKSIQALSWIPWVKHNERENYEIEAQKEGFVNFKFTKKSKHGGLVPVKQKANYFPVYYIAPFVGNESALGFDLSSNAKRLKALTKAAASGKIVTSEKVNLVQMKTDNAAVLVFTPIYKSESEANTTLSRTENLYGFISGVVKISSIISGGFSNNKKNKIAAEGIDIYVYDLGQAGSSINDDASLLYIHNSRLREMTQKAKTLPLSQAKIGLFFEKRISVGDRDWLFVARPLKVNFGYQTSSFIWLLFLFCLLLTIIFAYLRNNVLQLTKTKNELANYRDQLEEMVAQRTAKLQTLQQELLQKEKLATLGQITATVSHELRSPLGAMRPSLHILKKDTSLTNQGSQRAIERMERSINSCDSIIDEMLNFARFTPLNESVVQVNEWLAFVINEQNIEQAIKITQDFQLDDQEVLIDVERLQRAITNVVNNARYAMMNENKILKKGAEISIKTQERLGRIEIIITDNGIGMNDEVLLKIFEPLFSTRSFGLGLGMPIIKQIMQQHNGGVELTSKTGVGTSVLLWLPNKES